MTREGLPSLAWLRHVAARATLVVLAATTVAPGCKKKDDGTAPTANELPPIKLTDETRDVLLTWLDEKGNGHTAMSVPEVPPEGREKVRVVLTKSDDGASGDLFYVADLRTKQPDGSYPVQTMTRQAWDAASAERRGVRIDRPIASREAPQGDGDAKDVAIVYGAEWCKPCHDAEKFLRARQVPVVYKDIEQSEQARKEMLRKLEKIGRPGGAIPVLDVMGTVLVGFDPREIDRIVKKKKGGGAAEL